MRILLVDNGTVHVGDIVEALKDHMITVRAYLGHMDDAKEYDAVVLSGSSNHGPKDRAQHHRWFQNELEFIRRADMPIIGICMGFELICLAFNGELVDLGYKVTDNRKIEFLQNEFVPFWQAGKHIVYEAHHWSVQSVDMAALRIIAESDFGIEAVHHALQPIIGMQFHPEVRDNTQHLLDKLVGWEASLSRS